MGDKTGIEWTRGDDGTPGATWNPTWGCSRVSPGCENCYAERFAGRFSGPGQRYDGLVRLGKNGARWTGEMRLRHDALTLPVRWTKPRRIFVNSMSDLFHERLTNEGIAAVFGVMAACPRHTFQVLTKRADRMRDWFAWVAKTSDPDPWTECHYHALMIEARTVGDGGPLHTKSGGGVGPLPWPLPNVWLGVSAEDQQRANERIPALLQTPAAVRFVSYEPALGPVDFLTVGSVDGRPMSAMQHHPIVDDGDPGVGLDWVIVGGESGPGARPFDWRWARNTIEVCQAAGVAVFVKQLGTNVMNGLLRVPLRDRKGGDMDEWPEALRVREFPAGGSGR